ncbi:MAG: glycosyl hydrolase 115 family protein, partial [Gammaproteobacteria bacterium]
MEVPIEFFLTYAWNPARWPAERLPEYLKLWAAREFGPTHASDIADIVAKYAKYNGRRKPEQLEPGTYSLVNYNEAERIVDEYKAIAARAEAISASLPPERRDAFFQLVLYPVKAGVVVNEMMATAARNRLYAAQGRASTNDLAARVRALFREDAELARQYHQDIAGGKWNHMMSQTHLGYTFWNQPPRNVMPAVTKLQTSGEGDMGVAVEGSEQVWPRWGDASLALPELNPFDGQARYLEVFNRGEAPFDFTIAASDPWVTVSATKGSVRREERVLVNVRWAEVPAGVDHAMLTVTGPDGARAQVKVPLARQRSVAATKGAFIETGGVVAIEAPHYTRALAPQGRRWQLIPDHGRTGSAMTTLPVDAPALDPANAPMRLEYAMQLASSGKAEVQVTLAPTLKFQPGQGLHYGVSIDDEAPQIVNVHADASEKHWERIVSDGAAVFTTTHAVAKPGAHTLKFWTVDPGLVVQKLVVNMGGQKPSYLGPPESPTVGQR